MWYRNQPDWLPDELRELSRKIFELQLKRDEMDKEIEELIDTIPQKRLADAGEIAKTVVFLTSHHNTYITGQNIIVDGGMSAW